MFITFALSIGCAVAMLGLFLEWAGQRKWPTRRKMWGSLILTIGVLGIAPIISNHSGPLPVAAACSCLTLALSLCGSQHADEEEVVVEEAATALEEEIAFEKATLSEPDPADVLTEEMAAWLNIRISEGYEAKGNGLWAEAAAAFEAAVAVCVDRELKGMLEEELQDCLAQLPAADQTNVLQAS